MRSLMVMVVAVSAGACQPAHEHRAQVVLRVSAGHQLTCLHAQSGSSAYVRELVSPFVTDHALVQPRDERTLALWPHGPWPLMSAGELCDQVYADRAGAIVAREVVAGACVLGFDSAASLAEHGAALRVDAGPYRMVREVPLGGAGASPCQNRNLDPEAPPPVLARIELARKRPGGIDEIHLITMPVQEQWRRLYARDIDVVASMPTLYHERFSEMQTVRTMPLPAAGALTLHFNTRANAWASRHARRQLAALLDLDAIARVACRDPACRDLGPYALDLASGPESRPADRDPSRIGLPARVTIALLGSDSVSVRAAQVISYELRRQLDIEVVLDERSVTDIDRISMAGDFDLLLLPLALPDDANPERVAALLSRIRIGAWQDSAFERALAQANSHEIAAILRAQVPVVPLFQYMQFAAIDQRYCGAHPSSQTSWGWLDDLVPCAGVEAR